MEVISCRSQESRIPSQELMPLRKEEVSPCSCIQERPCKDRARRRLSPITCPHWHPDLGLPDCQTVRNKWLHLSHSVYDILSSQLKLRRSLARKNWDFWGKVFSPEEGQKAVTTWRQSSLFLGS